MGRFRKTLVWFVQVYLGIFGLWALAYSFGWKRALANLNSETAVILAVILLVVATIKTSTSWIKGK